ncbi:hypothetical protein ACQUFY_20730 [Robbsia andropogonis]|uniref:hypothetical protein n=1 Tax=Robbsia andropogonis TaxID=28092 RepID=UPI003D1F72BE
MEIHRRSNLKDSPWYPTVLGLSVVVGWLATLTLALAVQVAFLNDALQTMRAQQNGQKQDLSKYCVIPTDWPRAEINFSGWANRNVHMPGICHSEEKSYGAHPE